MRRIRFNKDKMSQPKQPFQSHTIDNSAILTRIVFFCVMVFVLSFVHFPHYYARSNLFDNETSPSLLTPLQRGSKAQDATRATSVSIAWLMSYPNSGTSYTHRLIRKVSNRTTATNYGIEHLFDKNNKLVHSNWTNGPFLTYPDQQTPNHVLTKTHCGGRCVHCGPSTYIETQESFQRRCFRTRGFFGPNHTEQIGYYSSSLVSKAIHLVRNPLDNIVSRFHLDHAQRLNNTMYQKRFPDNAKGFQQWCQDVDVIFGKEEQKVFDKDMIKLMRKLPCHGEFYRYTQWHNLAIETIKNLDIPVHILHYEDYKDKWEQTLSELLGFLELEFSTPDAAQTFVPGKEYSEYYTSKQRNSIQKLMKKVSTNETWQMLRQYFP